MSLYEYEPWEDGWFLAFVDEKTLGANPAGVVVWNGQTGAGCRRNAVSLRQVATKEDAIESLRAWRLQEAA